MRARSGRHRNVRPRVRPRRRVPVVIADTMTECGAACLAMVLRYFGRRVSVAECAGKCLVGRDGASALAVAVAARGYGLQVTPLRVENLDDLALIARPAILYWSFNHFVVLEKFRGKDAVIVDPARGRVTASRQELDEKFTGVALAMTLGPQFRPGGPRLPGFSWAIIGRALGTPGARRLISRIVLVSVLLTGLGLIGPAVTAILVNQVIPSGQRTTLTILALGAGLTSASMALANLMQSLLLVDLQNQVDRTLSVTFFEHLLRLPYGYFQRHSTGDLLSRMADNAQIRMVLTQSTLSGVVNGMLAVVYAAVLLAFSPTFGLAVVGFGLLQVLLVVVPARRVAQLTVATLSEAGKTNGFAAEALRGINSVKVGAGEAWALGRWRAQYEHQLTASSSQARLTGVISAALSAATSASTLALPFLAGLDVLSGRFSVGTMFGLIFLAANFTQPLTRLTASFQQLQSVQGTLHRLGTVLSAQPEQAGAPRRAAPALSGHIELVNVGLRHPGAAGWAVRHVSLTIPAGTRVAFVGPSGSGKSTLVSLILGLYPPTEGKILLDGCDLAGLDHQTVRRQCGVVTQEAAVFNGTIRQNIAFGTSGLTLADIRRAARFADLERDIEGMPMGYETIISENGSALSGGQRQRLALARALARRPAILILDEATSALDTLTEATISRNLASTTSTTITVAHRLSTIRHADIIIVMNDGTVTEIGDHSSLTAVGGLYATMASTV